MKKNLDLVLYTRPICSDCQDAKEYLASENIEYQHKNVGENPEFEEEMKEISGNRIVPLFAFYKKGVFGKRKLVKNLIGFDNNKEEIKSLLK
ncbi:glutaredoxin 3 [Virgibacillus subterraneus]|uniref:Glutaredoxin 3 n=1 Tax=Virgibacillus subterraneus TaxID=621109 RepID=A0A1H9G4L3_9BACI|nr:glutaredoxin family protein [Virgibacillus subterraneus]SEQ44980.1 glutaredoxin 3 [Virgibacillus subterraneus]